MKKLKVLFTLVWALIKNKEYIVVTSEYKCLSNEKDEIKVSTNIEPKKYWFYCSAMEQQALRGASEFYDLISQIEEGDRWN